MLVYLVTAITAFLYITQVPLMVAFRWEHMEKNGYGFGIALFSEKKAEENAVAREIGAKKHLPEEKIVKDVWQWDTVYSAKKTLSWIIRHAEPLHLYAYVRLGLDDAAKTALTVGGILSVFSFAQAALPGICTAHAQADFEKPVFEAEVSGIIRVKTGQVMLASAIGTRDFLFGRWKKWTNIRSKIS